MSMDAQIGDARMPQDFNNPESSEALLRPLASRSEIASFIVMDVMRAAAEAEAAGETVVHMEVGQPGTSAPNAAIEAVRSSVQTDRLGYTLATGNPELRRALAAHYQRQYGRDIAPERFVITSGSSAGFVLAYLMMFEPGDTIALPSPGYPCYRQVAKALDVETHLIETGPADRWMPTVEALGAAFDAGASGFMVASPANPTGTMLTPDRLEALVDLAVSLNLWFISDVIYHSLSYGVDEQTALAFSDQVVVVNSFSKYFSMTGWRVGWMVLPEVMVPAAERLTQNLYISAPAVSQVAAIAALSDAARDELETNKARYEANRQILLDGLPKVGLDKIVPADGAFYLYVDVSHLTDDSLSFARSMLAETGVAATPGLDFDSTRGSGFIRFSYAGTGTDMRSCLERLAGWTRLNR